MQPSRLKTLTDVEIDPDYELIGDFDELLEIDEIDDEPVSATANEFGAWTEERVVD